MKDGIETDLIYDVGLHKGEDSEFYLKKGFRVVAIEALPTLAKFAAERLRGYVDSGQLVILNVAVAENDSPVTFLENPDNSVWGTASAEWALRNKRQGRGFVTRTVQGMDFASIVRRFGVPYYLKIDIEGSDLLCLEALKHFGARPKYISIESTKESWNLLRNEFALFKALGYSKFKVVPQHIMTAQVCPFPAKEGGYVDHQFEDGSSGTFGEEAPGEWIDEADALRIYRSIFLRSRMFGDHSLIRRVLLAQRFLRKAKSASTKIPTDDASERQSPEIVKDSTEVEVEPTRPANWVRSSVQRLLSQSGWYDTHAKLG
jgi:FkbM family methyltransferase